MRTWPIELQLLSWGAPSPCQIWLTSRMDTDRRGIASGDLAISLSTLLSPSLFPAMLMEPSKGLEDSEWRMALQMR